MKKVFLICAVVTIFSFAVSASVILQDSFSYPDGPLVTAPGTIWHTHSGTPDQVDVAGGKVNLTQSESEDVNTVLAGGPYGAASGTNLYVRFTLNFSALPSGAGGFFAHFNNTSFRCKLFATTNGAAPGFFRLGISAGATSPSATISTDLGLNTDYMVVIRLSTSDDVSTLWLNPVSEGDASIVSVDAATALNISTFAFRQSLSSGSGMGTLTIDDLVIGTSFADVVNINSNDGPPIITSQPSSQTVIEGQAATFSVSATGAQPLSFQWQFNGADLDGETNASLSLTGVTTNQAGTYLVIISNTLDSTNSDTVTLTVQPHSPVLAIVRFTNTLSNLTRPGDAVTSTNLTEYALRPTETITIETASYDTEGRLVTIQPETNGLPAGASWSFVENSGTNVPAAFTFTPSQTDAGTAFAFVLPVMNADGTNAVTWSIYVPAPDEQRFYLSEFLANPTTNPAAPFYNPLHRDTPSPANKITTEDEYIELVNLSSNAMDLTDWSVSDAITVRHKFFAGDSITSSNAIIVYGGSAAGSVPNLPANVLSFAATESASGLALNNGGDTITVRNGAGHIVERVVYTQSMLSSDSSLTRYPDLNSAFAAHSSVSTNVVSPGTLPDGRAFNDSGTTPPPVITVSVTAVPGSSVTLQWNADPARTYSILQSETANGAFSSLANGLSFADGQGQFTDNDLSGVSARFYLISTP